MNPTNRALIVAAIALGLVAGLFWWTQYELAQRDAAIKELRSIGTGVGETMLLVQNHAARVWFAGGGDGASGTPNWAYAEHGIDELNAAFERMAVIEPIHEGVPMTALYRGFRELQLQQLKKAIAAKDRAAFATAYDGMIAACNACHAQSGHPYVVIQRPTDPPATNQKFGG